MAASAICPIPVATGPLACSAAVRTPMVNDHGPMVGTQVEVTLKPVNGHQLSASLQRQTQIHHPVVYLFTSKIPKPADSWHYQFSYQYAWKSDRYVQLNAYLQQMDNLLTVASPLSHLVQQSSLNWFEDIPLTEHIYQIPKQKFLE